MFQASDGNKHGRAVVFVTHFCFQEMQTSVRKTFGLSACFIVEAPHLVWKKKYSLYFHQIKLWQLYKIYYQAH